MRASGFWPIRSDIRLRIRTCTLFWSIRRWLNGRSLGTGKFRRSLGGHRRGHAYCNDSVLGDQRYHDRPGRPPDLHHPDSLIIREWDCSLEADSLAFNVLEIPEGLLGDTDGILGASIRSMSKTFAWSKLGKAVGRKGTYIVVLRRASEHKSRVIAIDDEVCENLSSRCGA